MSSWQVIVALLSLLTGCVTAGQRTDIGGRAVSYGEPTEIDREDSRVDFVGDVAPGIIKTEVRMRDNKIREERLELAGGVKGMIYVEFAPVLFDEESTAYVRNPETARAAAEVFCNIPPEKPVTGTNANGQYVYSTCDFGAGYKCVVAVQGLGISPMAGAASGYKALADFRYCTKTESDEQVLRRLATLRIVD